MMEVTIDKFGRILIPKKLRQLLGLQPGQRIILKADKENRKLAVELPVSQDEVKIVKTEFGFPVIHTGEAILEDFDSNDFMKETLMEYLDKKMGLE